jgi:GH18 family chitinase
MVFTRKLIVSYFLPFLLVLIGILSVSINAQAQNPINETRKLFKRSVRPLINEKRRTERDLNKVNKLISKNKRSFDASQDTNEVIVWYKKPYIPNKGMIQDYQHVYQFLHSQEAVYFDKNDLAGYEIVWDSLNNTYFRNEPVTAVKDPNFELFGWVPYWMAEASPYFQYRLLSKAAYYSYEINSSDGSHLNPEIFEPLKTYGFVDSCKVYQVESYLSVSLIGGDDITNFFKSREKQNFFFDQVLPKIEEYGFDGIEINFEDVPATERDSFANFVKTLGMKLSQQADRLERPQKLMVDLPYYDGIGAYDVATMNPFVAHFNVLGYSFSGEAASYPSSISPLRSAVNRPNLETAVNDVLNEGISSKKILLSLPLFGETWRVTGAEQGVPPVFENSLMYGDILATMDVDYYPIYDPYTASSFYMIDDNVDGERFICWFESDQSFTVKSDWMRQKNLGGMGLWALGYDKGDAEFWEGMERLFMVTKDSLTQITPLKVENGMLFGIMKHIIENQKIFGIAFIFFATALLIGFVISLFDWKVREILFTSTFFRYFNAAVILVFCLIGFSFLYPSILSTKVLLLAFLAGVIAIALSSLAFSVYRKTLQ